MFCNSDLCSECVDAGCILLSLSSIEQRFGCPKSYYLFYDHFYKAVLGDQAWKEAMKDQDENSHIGNYTTEAFALLIIMNNYKAWLHEEKMKHGDKLITEYEVEGDDPRESIVDHWLKDLEFKKDQGYSGEFILLEDRTKTDYIISVKERY